MLNNFGPSTGNIQHEDEQQLRWKNIATRLYFFILFNILVALAAVSWLSTELTTITVRYPSREVFQDLPYDVQCPCSHGSVSYEDFTSLEPTFHQVCTSDFVSDRWIETIFSGSNSTYFSLGDLRRFGSGQFQALASFCRLSMGTIQESISTFKLTTLIGLSVLPEMVLKQQTKAAIEHFTSVARKRFSAQLALVLQLTLANRLVSGLQTNQGFIYKTNGSHLISIGTRSRSTVDTNGTVCDCLVSAYCKYPAVFDDVFGASRQESSSQFITIPGLYSGCLPVISMLSSSLECFYNQTCVDFILSFFPTSTRFTAMDASQESTFSRISTVQLMVDYLMVENWTIDISYQRYYLQCAPVSCTYSHIRKKGFVFALIKLISLLATVTSVLGMAIPNLIDLIRARLNVEASRHIKISDRLKLMREKIVKLVIELNIFGKELNNNQLVSRQIYATRFYIVLLITSLIILSTYTLLSQSIYRQTVFNPSESEYLQLEQAHSTSLSCPCTSVNMSYSMFITSTPHYHQLCSSDLITFQWLQYSLSGMKTPTYIYDYRMNAAVQFTTLAFLCEFAQQTVNDALDSFLQTELVGLQVIQKKLFETQMYALIQEWNSTTLNQFVRGIQLIRNTTHSNQLLNRLNIYLFTNENSRTVWINPRDYRGCPCVFSRTCKSNMGIFVYDSITNDYLMIYGVPNFYVGCYLVDALFMSTLECFYNETCMLALDQYLDSSLRQSIRLPLLNATLNPPDETVESIVNRLMLDSWPSSVNFSNYYTTCAPSACTFEYRDRNDLFSAITTIIGVFGGLSLGYNLIILLVLQMMEEFTNGLSAAALLQLRRRLFSCDTDEKRVHRLHVLLVIIILTSLYSMIFFTPKLITIETQKPSLSDYEQLVDRYSGSVQCACSRISIKYQSFVELQARFHPICNDGFMSRYWLFVWSNGPIIYNLASRDYVYSGSGQVLAIMSLCDLSQQVVTDSFRQLLSSDFISAQLLSSDLLYQRMRKMIDYFLMTIPKSTINTLSLIRETTSANMIMNTLSNNWVFVGDNVYDNWAARTRPVSYPDCICGLSAQCTDTVLGVRYGCYVIEALWQTTFEAFYDNRRLGLNLSFPTLNISAHPSRFEINATIGSVVNELMVEEFFDNISYANYFAECAPSVCITSYTDRSRVFDGITILISLYGGLVIICQVMAMTIMKLLRGQQNKHIYPIIQ